MANGVSTETLAQAADHALLSLLGSGNVLPYQCKNNFVIGQLKLNKESGPGEE